MRILWLTIDRATRIQLIHQPIMEEMKKLEDVTIYSHARCSREAPEGEQIRLLGATWVNTFDVVFTDAVFGYMCEEWDKVTVLKCCYLLDLHALPFIKQVCLNFNFDVFFHRTRAAWRKVSRKWGQYGIWLPHSFDPVIFHPLATAKKEYQVLSIGEIAGSFYPVRQQAHLEMKGTEGYRRIERPARKALKPWPVRDDYAEQLGMARIAISSCCTKGYPVMKTFEIPACGTALATNTIAEFADLGLVEGVNYIGLDDRSRGAIRKKLKWWLAPQQESALAALTAAGTKLAHERHTAAVRARELQVHLRRLLEERNGKG